jgi:hypothetical protein
MALFRHAEDMQIFLYSCMLECENVETKTKITVLCICCRTLMSQFEKFMLVATFKVKICTVLLCLQTSGATSGL